MNLVWMYSNRIGSLTLNMKASDIDDLDENWPTNLICRLPLLTLISYKVGVDDGIGGFHYSTPAQHLQPSNDDASRNALST